jgi:hypothetical protein
VDTWQGDEHAGFYGEDVFQAVATHNAAKYSAFSTLLRMRFEDAVDYFADGSIDLLHIDGRHLYEDIVGDFKTWRPKLSEGAVVLFHDINVRERGFGVWKFFSAIAAEHPHFHFLHGHGLGVLAPGSCPSAVLNGLFAASDEDADAIRAAYAALGRSLTVRKECKELTMQLRHPVPAPAAPPKLLPSESPSGAVTFGARAGALANGGHGSFHDYEDC